MATNMHRKYTESKVEEWAVPAGTVSGDLVRHAVTGKAGVALTGRGDSVKDVPLPSGQTLSGVPNGGLFNKPTTSVVATDGSFRFEVEGVTAGETVAGTGTPQGTPVYVTEAGVKTLTEGDEDAPTTLIGRVDDCNIVGTRVAIQIGVSA